MLKLITYLTFKHSRLDKLVFMSVLLMYFLNNLLLFKILLRALIFSVINILNLYFLNCI